MSSLGIFNKETKTYQKVAGTAEAAVVDAEMSDTSTNTVQNKVIKAYVDKKASENVDFSTSTSKLLNDTVEAPLVLSKATRNLLNPTLQTTTQNGVTCTNNCDGTYTFNGTATKDVTLYIAGSPVKNTFGGYKLLGCPTNGSEDTYRIVVSYYGNGEWKAEGSDIGNGVIIDGTYYALNYLIKVKSGVTVNNLVFKPMITTDLSATYDDFVPYSGYDIKTCGKNIVGNPSNFNSPTVKDGVVTFPAKSAATNDTYLRLYSDVDISAFDTFRVVVESIGETINNSYKSYVIIKTAGKKEFSTLTTTSFESSANKYVSNVFNCSDFGNKIAEITVVIKKGYAYPGGSYKVSVFNGEDKEFSNWIKYVESSVHIDSSTEFPLLWLKSFNGTTNIISPGNVKVTYAKSDSGKAILDMSGKNVAELNETVNTLKKSVSDGKTKVANAITDKGVETATDATFDVMAENISKIETGGGELHGATLAVSTEESTLFGQTVTLTLDGASVATTVFADNGTCSFVVQNPGTYTITCGEAHKDVTVTGDNVVNKTVISVELSLLKIVAFATGTDEEIAAMIEAHYNDKINIADYWSVGDTRSVSLSAMSATGVGESHRAQTVQFVIGDFNHDDLTAPINGHTKAAVTILQKDCLMDATSASYEDQGYTDTEIGYMNSTDTNVGGWKNCARRTWCNNVYFGALPSAWQSMVKTVNKKVSVGNSQSTIETVQDKIFLAAEIEIWGSTKYSYAGEGTQYQYYKNATANKYKMPKWSPSHVTQMYFDRSPSIGVTNCFCSVHGSGAMSLDASTTERGFAPCLCI